MNNFKVFIDSLVYIISFIISIINNYNNLIIELEKERNLTSSLKKELEQLKKQDSIIECSNYKMILKYSNERNRILFESYKILKLEFEEIKKNINSHISEINNTILSNEIIEEEIEIDIDTCPNCHINKITTFVPCKQHSYCDKCLLKNNCYICKSYLIYHKKIR